MAVGIVGGVARIHPKAQLARSIANIRSATDLAKIVAAVGLAQNLGALRALAAEGIQHGHMRLHARNVAAEAGAQGEEIAQVAQIIADRGAINQAAAQEALLELRAKNQAAEKSINERFKSLREQYDENLSALFEQVLEESASGQTLTAMLRYHIETGGKAATGLTAALGGGGLGGSR